MNSLVAGPPDRQSTERRDGSAGLLELLAMLRRHLWLIMVVGVTGTALVLFGTLQLTPRYTATTDLLVETQVRNVVNIEAVLAGVGSDDSAIESQVAVLKSRALIRRAVAKLGLNSDPEFNPSMRQRPGPIAEFFSLAWLKSFMGRDGPSASADQTLRATEVVINKVLESLVVARQPNTFVIQVNFTSEDPAKAALIANTIAELYLLEQFEAKFEATQRATGWLNERLSALREDVSVKTSAVERYRAENNLVVAEGSSVVEQQLADLNGQLAAIRADRAAADAKYQRVRQLLASGGDIATLADVLASNTIADLKRNEAELIRKEAELSSRYGDLHPELINVRAERTDITAQLAIEVQKIIANLENEADVVARREAALRQSLDELKSNVMESNRAEVQLAELQRQADAARTLYETFLGRFGETEQQETNHQADARIISAATPPVGPSFPVLKLNLALGLFISFAIAVVIAALLDRLDSGFRKAEQIENVLGIPLLGSVPKLGQFRRSGTAVTEYLLKKPASAFSESLRSLRTAIMLSNVDHPPKVVLFTSSVPGEGKTTSALAMARTAAASGVRTLLIDADLRRPTVHKAFKMKPTSGLVEIVSGSATFDESLIHDAESSLDVIGVAGSTPSPPDLLGSEHMLEVLNLARQRYDLVVVDSPPVLPVSDSRVLAQACDTTVFVVRWEETPREIVQRAVRDLRQGGTRLAGIVFAQVDMKKQSRRYYGGYGYYYYRRYKGYYSD